MPAISIEVTNETMNPDGFMLMCERGLEILKDLTPVDTGFCRDQWEIAELSGSYCQYYNSTEYVSYLDDGWSKQAPDGMTRPFLRRLKALKQQYA